MLAPSSHRSHRSLMVNCCMVQYNPSALRTDSSPVGQANPTAMTLDMTKERIQKLFNNMELYCVQCCNMM
ncbi:hypothetical protein L2E82_14346 [Cichorium intybus]|uniref:Uncharacterized protein n=1 Tax=Cichorium intybus TaxID=13427 RepID=A0ACB9EZF5_CICIN|nr:hypothetical protein L2E82_14346 [Cichorium intybus]